MFGDILRLVVVRNKICCQLDISRVEKVIYGIDLNFSVRIAYRVQKRNSILLISG